MLVFDTVPPSPAAVAPRISPGQVEEVVEGLENAAEPFPPLSPNDPLPGMPICINSEKLIVDCEVGTRRISISSGIQALVTTIGFLIFMGHVDF